jgi:hypothetical protein
VPDEASPLVVSGPRRAGGLEAKSKIPARDLSAPTSSPPQHKNALRSPPNRSALTQFRPVGRATNRWSVWSPLVNIALKLNVVVFCAVFLFVGAILIGAF